MFKNFTLIVALGTLVLLGIRALEAARLAEVDPARTTEIHSVVLEYAYAMQVGDHDMLEGLLHAKAEKFTFERFPPRLSFAFQSHDRREIVTDMRPATEESTFAEIEPDEIEVLDSTVLTASAKLSGAWGIEYLQLLRAGNGWQIIQVLGVDPGLEADSVPLSARASLGS